MPKKNYEVLTRVDFGFARDNNGNPKAASEQPEITGVYEPTPEGEPNPTVSLDEKEALPLLEAGSIRPAGEENPRFTDKPEEYGYQGEEARNKAMKEDEVYTKSAKASGKDKG